MNGITKFIGRPTIVLKVDRFKPDYGRVVTAIMKDSPQAVFWIGSGSTVVDGIKALRAAGSFVPVLTLSNNASSGFIKMLGKDSTGVIVSQVFPAERALSYAMIRQAQDLAKAKGLAGVSPAMLEGFAGAKVLVEALRHAGASPTRESVVAALNGMKSFDLGGLVIHYSATNHTGLDFSDLSIISRDGKFVR
jgi:ABC-type branched-subunit amino acid transport system substrate-binding protein